jgi:hypothetical protein
MVCSPAGRRVEDLAALLMVKKDFERPCSRPGEEGERGPLVFVPVPETVDLASSIVGEASPFCETKFRGLVDGV